MVRLFKNFSVFSTVVLFLSPAFSYSNKDLHLIKIKSYYGQKFLDQVSSHQLKNEELVSKIFEITKSAHVQSTALTTSSLNRNQLGIIPEDNLVSDCSSVALHPDQRCKQHRSLGYDKARVLIFGQLYLTTSTDGNYQVEDVYCEKSFTNDDFNGKPSIGPNLVPKDASVINTEHTWPQSRFTGRFDKGMQKSDLHHLYPTDSQMNSTRGSLRFGHVDHDIEILKCPMSRLGRPALQEGVANSGTVFEPPVKHRGNVARSIFYFAARYQMKLSPVEEKWLRIWNKEDPVDQFEVEKNNFIEEVQGNRNPFVDLPHLIDDIESF